MLKDYLDPDPDGVFLHPTLCGTVDKVDDAKITTREWFIGWQKYQRLNSSLVEMRVAQARPLVRR